MAGHVALFQLHAADAVLEASLPTHSRNIDLESAAEAFYSGLHSRTRHVQGLRRACDWQGPEERRGRVPERYVPSRKTGPAHNKARTPYLTCTPCRDADEVRGARPTRRRRPARDPGTWPTKPWQHLCEQRKNTFYLERAMLRQRAKFDRTFSATKFDSAEGHARTARGRPQVSAIHIS